MFSSFNVSNLGFSLFTEMAGFTSIIFLLHPSISSVNCILCFQSSCFHFLRSRYFWLTSFSYFNSKVQCMALISLLNITLFSFAKLIIVSFRPNMSISSLVLFSISFIPHIALTIALSDLFKNVDSFSLKHHVSLSYSITNLSQQCCMEVRLFPS